MIALVLSASLQSEGFSISLALKPSDISAMHELQGTSTHILQQTHKHTDICVAMQQAPLNCDWYHQHMNSTNHFLLTSDPDEALTAEHCNMELIPHCPVMSRHKVEICVRQVYKAKKGMQDVAVKTIHSRLVSPHVPVSEAADNIDRVSTPPCYLFCWFVILDQSMLFVCTAATDSVV